MLASDTPNHTPNFSKIKVNESWQGLTSGFPGLFSGVCRPLAGGPIAIRLRKGTVPRNAYSTRAIPICLREAFNRELDDQLAAGIIEPAEDTNDPSEWLNPMVVTRKKDPTKCRITVDLRDLNKASLRPVFTALSPWQTVCTIPSTARFFTVLDGLKGFHQVELDEASRKLTTFVTPRGRMRYRQMPMG